VVATVLWEPFIAILGVGLVVGVAGIAILVWALASEADARHDRRHRAKKD
jgi:hypothetical protein